MNRAVRGYYSPINFVGIPTNQFHLVLHSFIASQKLDAPISLNGLGDGWIVSVELLGTEGYVCLHSSCGWIKYAPGTEICKIKLETCSKVIELAFRLFLRKDNRMELVDCKNLLFKIYSKIKSEDRSTIIVEFRVSPDKIIELPTPVINLGCLSKIKRIRTKKSAIGRWTVGINNNLVIDEAQKKGEAQNQKKGETQDQKKDEDQKKDQDQNEKKELAKFMSCDIFKIASPRAVMSISQVISS